VLARKSRADLTGEHLRISASGSLPLFVVELPGFLGRASDPEDPLIQPQWHSWLQQAQALVVGELSASSAVDGAVVGWDESSMRRN
jgi:hypothetical protein